MKKNTKKNMKKKSRVKDHRGTRWCLTIHGANPDGSCPILLRLIEQFQKDEYILAAVAYETGEYGIHPHWQVYFQTSKQSRLKMKFSHLLGEEISFHLQTAKGTRNANLVYVYGVHKEHEIGWLHYTKGHHPPVSYNPYKTQNLLWLRGNMKPWQKQITAKVTQKQADYRDILWVWESEGNTGKTYLAKYLHYFYGAILTGGSSSDMKHAIARWKQITGHYPITIIVDVSRADTIRKDGYKAIEQMKNALFFSGKYQSGMVASCNPPNIIVFANYSPDLRMMSPDRWVIRKIDPKTHQLVPWLSHKYP